MANWGGAAKGAASGALAGAALGPWGAAAGGAIGGIAGLFSGGGGSSTPPPPAQISAGPNMQFVNSTTATQNKYAPQLTDLRGQQATDQNQFLNSVRSAGNVAYGNAMDQAHTASTYQQGAAHNADTAQNVATGAQNNYNQATGVLGQNINSFNGMAGQGPNVGTQALGGFAGANQLDTSGLARFGADQSTGQQGILNVANSGPNQGVGDINSFYNRAGTNPGMNDLLSFSRQGEGPSAADAMLAKQSDEAMAMNVALAHSGRGAGSNAAAMRQAMFQNAGQQQQLGNDMSALRAREHSDYSNRQLQAMSAYQQANQGQQGLELSGMGAYQNAMDAYQNRQLGAYGTLAGNELGGMSAAGNLNLGARGQNLTAAQSYAAGLDTNRGQQLNALGGAQQGASTMGAQAIGNYNAGTSAALGYGNQGLGYFGAGINATQNAAANQLGANQLIGGTMIAGQGLQQNALGNEIGFNQGANKDIYNADYQLNRDNAQMQNGYNLGATQLNQQQNAADNAFLGSIMTGAAAIAKGGFGSGPATGASLNTGGYANPGEFR